MELSYVFNAVRRYWWIVVACAIAGAGIGYSQAKPVQFVSRATLSIDPSSPGASPNAAAESPDRFIATEVGVLTSQDFAVAVAKQLGPDESPIGLQRLVTITNRSGTDIVDVVAKTPNGERSRAIVNAYIDVYTERVKAEAAREQAALVAAYDGSMQGVRQQLAKVDSEISQALAPYLNGPGVLPTIDQVRPDLATQKASLQNQLNTLQQSKTTAQLAGPSIGSTQVIEPGTDPVATGRRKIMIVGPFTAAALLAGVFLVVLLARLSRRVLDAEEVGEIMGQPVLGRLPRGLAPSVARGRWWRLPPEIAVFLDELCTRVESSERRGRGLTVLVAGAEPDSNADIVAASMAARFGLWGLDVVLADADPRAAELFVRSGTPRQSITAVIAEADSATTRLRPAVPPEAGSEAASAPRRMTLVGMSDEADAVALRRNGPEKVLSILSERCDVVIVSAGPLLEARTSAQLAQMADVVVLVVPVRRQIRRRLHAVAQLLEGRRGELVVVDDNDERPPVADMPEPRTDQSRGDGSAAARTREEPTVQPGTLGGSA
jgi:capsular polysaccharide biosynthesis protein